MQKRDFLIAFNLIPHIQSKTIFELIKQLDDISDIKKLKKSDLLNYSGIGEKTADKIAGFDFERRLQNELKKAEKQNVKIITKLDDDYPYLLKNIDYQPLVLYIKGELPSDEDVSISIVGTRRPTTYGKVAGSKIAADLAGAGVTITSGLARGIDSIAHKAALNAGGKTVAVLGSGLDIIYPPEHRRLYSKIIESGAAITEFPFATKPERNNFPIRNRIISGISIGTLIVEASEKSGTLITAKYAIEQGRELFAVPGNITSRQSIGTNYLIKNGARLVQRADDIIDELPDNLRQKITEKKGPDSLEDDECQQENDLDEMEKKILSVLEFDKPQHVDVVCAILKEQPHNMWQHLLALEMKNAVLQLEGKMFIRKM